MGKLAIRSRGAEGLGLQTRFRHLGPPKPPRFQIELHDITLPTPHSPILFFSITGLPTQHISGDVLKVSHIEDASES
jgi:hypothetical protein